MKVKRLYSIDIFRIICALIVFMFHSHISEGIEIGYGIFNIFINYGHLFMVAFFMLSGFSLYYVDYEKNNCEGFNEIGKSLLKRIISIFPLYIITAVFYKILYNDLSLVQNITFIPLELSMLASVFQGSFSVSHVGGTWFISCIFISYLLYPYLRNIVYKNSDKGNAILFVLLLLFSSYSFILVYFFNFSDTYTNPFFRIIEFFLGVLVANYFEKNKQKNIRQIEKLLIPVLYGILIFIVSIIGHVKSVPVQFFNFFAIIIFGLVLYLSARLEYLYPIQKLRGGVLIMSENTYAFFLAQFFTWGFIKEFNNYLHLNNVILFMFCFIWCLIISLFMTYVIQKPIKKFLERRIWKK